MRKPRNHLIQDEHHDPVPDSRRKAKKERIKHRTKEQTDLWEPRVHHALVY
jgi:hypothetical protein